MHGFAHAYPRALRIWRAYICPAKFEVHVDTHYAADRRSLEELMWSEGKALCRQESRPERAERMVTGGGGSATPSRKTSGAKTVETGKIRPLFVAY